ncbi:MAG TPA: hypothetical protein IGS17_14250 [Oscillatoriales cyanobacterium M59_W2019_021]|nr:hypothetical protein [Oscillatoriales cyanobacterium M4454_W2019_049]HIK52065.1 hypothetical protein [Oscillatoriales cyanobacterium M59_W2019_021]
MDELRSALNLATDEELQGVTQILFQPRFNPLDYVSTPDPIDLQSQSREQWLNAIEKRFRFLAADGVTVLLGQSDRFTYRQALIQVCRYLKIPYFEDLSTTDLEAEVFLHLMGKAWQKLPEGDRAALTVRIQQSLAKQLTQPLPLSVQSDPIRLLVKGGSALAVSSVLQPLLLRQIARQFAVQFARYQLAKETLVRGGAIAAGRFKSYVALQTARRGMAVSAARYGAARSAFAFLGPAMWAWFFADIGWRAIATNYARIIPTIFALAQIRLTRSSPCWECA